MLPIEQQGLFVHRPYGAKSALRVFIGGANGRRYFTPFGVGLSDAFTKHRLIPCPVGLSVEDFKKFERVSPGNLVGWDD